MHTNRAGRGEIKNKAEREKKTKKRKEQREERQEREKWRKDGKGGRRIGIESIEEEKWKEAKAKL